MTDMRREALEAPEAAARFLQRNRRALEELGARLRLSPPPVVLTSARGSSDHAASYFSYLAEILLGVPCASIGASVASVYGADLKAKGCVAITISQSGRSPDIVALQHAFRQAGALTVALVNDEASPAAANADICLPLHAGPELSVAATKSFIASLVAAAAIIAQWRSDARLLAAVEALPEHLAAASRIDWPDFVAHTRDAESLYVLGRGPALPVAMEAALKLKETCAIHAEAHSLAEVMHGPLELISEGFPVFAFSPDDKSRPSAEAAIAKLRQTGASVLVAGPDGLTHAETGDPLLDPVSMIQTCYLAIERVALARGRDPDRPRHLLKVTRTV